MKKLILLAILVMLVFAGHRKFVKSISTDEGLAAAIASANKKFPKDLPNGARLEQMSTEPGLRIINRVTLPVYERDLNLSTKPDMSEFACKDSEGRMFLDHGVTWVFIFVDKAGYTVIRQEVKAADCK